MVSPPASVSSRTATWNSDATSSRAISSWPLRTIVGTGRRPSRESSVSGVAGGVPCACGSEASRSRRMARARRPCLARPHHRTAIWSRSVVGGRSWRPGRALPRRQTCPRSRQPTSRRARERPSAGLCASLLRRVASLARGCLARAGLPCAGFAGARLASTGLASGFPPGHLASSSLAPPVLRPPLRAPAFRAPLFLAPRFAMSRVAPCASHCSQPARRKQIHCPMYDRA